MSQLTPTIIPTLTYKHTYAKLNKKSLKSCFLIKIREEHIIDIMKGFLHNDIVSLEYIDNNIKLNNIKHNKKIIINDESRTQFLINLFLKESIIETAEYINEICK